MFISDLLTLDVDGFLSQEGKVVEEEDRDDFKRFLQNYIKNNCLCNSLLHDIIGLMVKTVCVLQPMQCNVFLGSDLR